MKKLILTVNAIPVAQPRQRHRIVKTNNTEFVQNYTCKSDPVNAFKARIQHALAEVYNGPPLDCALIIDILFIFPRPKGKVYKTKPMPPYPKTTKPDKDNLEKSVYDALNGLLYRDDSQIFAGNTIKLIASGNEQPRVIIKVSSIECFDNFLYNIKSMFNYNN